MQGKRPINDLGFTLVDLMMGATILVVGLVALIEAVLIGSEMQATARRQTIAAQIVSNEIELLRLKDWATISALRVTAWNSATNYNVTDIVSSGSTWYRCIANHTNQVPPNATYWATISAMSVMAWDSTTNYKVTDVVNSGGTWYRCIANHANRIPPNAAYWAIYSGPISSTGVDLSATYSLVRSRADMPNGLIEVTFFVTWTVKPTGYPLSRTYTRIVTAYFGKYGLNLTYRRT